MKYIVPTISEVSQSSFCCHIDTDNQQQCARSIPNGDDIYAVEYGPESSDFTHSCAPHLGEMCPPSTDRVYLVRAPITRDIDIVFDGPPNAHSGRFIETEVPEVGERKHVGLQIGEWIEQPERGTWALRIPVNAGWLVG